MIVAVAAHASHSRKAEEAVCLRSVIFISFDSWSFTKPGASNHALHDFNSTPLFIMLRKIVSHVLRSGLKYVCFSPGKSLDYRSVYGTLILFQLRQTESCMT